jgi:hypothetical protein
LIGLLALTLHSPVEAATYFVSNTGSDQSAGRSLASAWRTMAKAAAAVEPGDMVDVAGGSYPERVLLTRSGEPGRAITLQARGTVTLEGFDIRASYVRVVGFDITNRNQTEITGQGVRVHGSHDVLSRNSIHDLCFEGIFLIGGAGRDTDETAVNEISDNTIRAAEMTGIHVEGRYNLIARNDISDTRQYPPGCPRRNRADADGIRFFGTGNVITGNYIHAIAIPGTEFNVDPHTDCFQTWGPARDIRVNHNWCEMPARLVDPHGPGNHMASIENFAGTLGALNFAHNIVINVGQGLIIEGDGASPIDGVTFANDTMVDVLEEGIILKNATTVRLVNSIFWNVGSGKDNYLAADSRSAGFTARGNDLYMPDGSAPGRYGSDAPHLTLDPGFRDPGHRDFRLSPASPVTGMGAELEPPQWPRVDALQVLDERGRPITTITPGTR